MLNRLNFKTFFACCGVSIGALAGPSSKGSEAPLTVGQVLSLPSTALGETRRISIWRPPGTEKTALPVVYLLDGGPEEDLLHVVGLLQVGAANRTLRPFMLVGIENTQRRRDLTGPTSNAEDKKIAPVVGGAATFRKFLVDELIPEIERRYHPTSERALVGESLAALFVVETALTAPGAFSTYVAVDPSLWWNDGWLLQHADALLGEHPPKGITVALAHSNEPRLAETAVRLQKVLSAHGVAATVDAHPNETHATVLHPALLQIFRKRLGPPAR